MKKIISEQRLNSIISEAIQEAALRNTIKRMVVEEIGKLVTEKAPNYKKAEGGESSADNDENTKTFQAIINGPHSDKYNIADFGRQVLDPDHSMSDDALRSYASKVVNGDRPMPPGKGAKAIQWLREK